MQPFHDPYYENQLFPCVTSSGEFDAVVSCFHTSVTRIQNKDA